METETLKQIVEIISNLGEQASMALIVYIVAKAVVYLFAWTVVFFIAARVVLTIRESNGNTTLVWSMLAEAGIRPTYADYYTTSTDREALRVIFRKAREGKSQ